LLWTTRRACTRARAEGLRLIDGLRLGDELAIIAAGAQVRVACGPTDHQRTLRAALRSIEPRDGPTRVDEAVALARRLLSGSEKMPKVVILTDGGFDAATRLAHEADVELISLGKKTDNIGITRLQARRSLLDPIGYEVLVEVQSACGEPVSFRLELDLDDDPIDVVPLTLAPGERRVALFEKTSAKGGHLRARIDRSDALLADNTAWAILPSRERQAVRLVTPGNLFLEKVFEAIPLVDLEIVRVANDGQAPEPPPPVASSSGPVVTVYHRRVPDALPPGPLLFIEPERSAPLWQLGEALHNPVVAKQDKDSPLMAHTRLDNVLMPEARKLTLKTPARVLAESAGGDPLYAVLDRPAQEPSGKVVLLNVDLEKSDLPLQTAFPIMVANLLSWFGGTKGELREAVAAGSVAEVEFPPEKSARLERWLRAPDGREQPLGLAAGTTRLTVGPLDRAGVWSVIRRSRGAPAAAPDFAGGGLTKRISQPGEIEIELACNVADRRESDLRPPDGLPERKTNRAIGWAVRPIWYYLLATAWLLTCWEWFLYQRRWID
jgi:von Willebrand factor type A domain